MERHMERHSEKHSEFVKRANDAALLQKVLSRLHAASRPAAPPLHLAPAVAPAGTAVARVKEVASRPPFAAHAQKLALLAPTPAHAAPAADKAANKDGAANTAAIKDGAAAGATNKDSGSALAAGGLLVKVGAGKADADARKLLVPTGVPKAGEGKAGVGKGVTPGERLLRDWSTGFLSGKARRAAAAVLSGGAWEALSAHAALAEARRLSQAHFLHDGRRRRSCQAGRGKPYRRTRLWLKRTARLRRGARSCL
ncbi:hypothetical protein T484DRAFT_1859291 [Baffinella frigidus]|nr:hypothetical protein T484DRAFT_1859291 [Cryptophyta sp. CCMP2293]